MIGRLEAWSLHLATAIAGVTGVVYGVMRYLMQPVDEFAVVNHPWQPLVLHLHVLGAPLLVFAVGLIWKRHIADRWRRQDIMRRRSGLVIAALFALMAMSGYLLQVSVAPGARRLWMVAHVASSIAWLAGYGLHQLGARRARDAPLTLSSAAPSRAP